MTNLLNRFPRINNTWMDTKHTAKHWWRRRKRAFKSDITVRTPHNVLFIIIDCLRADHVSSFGADRQTTPVLDQFEAAAYTNAKAPSSWTFPSVPSILSGRYPSEHGGRFPHDPRNLSAEQFPRLPHAGVPMLPDLLAGAGYDTSMITAIPMASQAVGDRFQTVSVRYTPANERVSTAQEWIADRDKWFCYLHLGDPHAPLTIPDDYREFFDVPDMEGIDEWRFRETTDGDSFERYRIARIRAYEAAIRSATDAVGELLAAVDEETIVVICGDHGEAFWEHPKLERELNDDPRGYYATDHGHSVFEELIRVPLWVRAPGLDSSHSADPISLIDVAPTVLAAIDAEIPTEISGIPLQEDETPRSLFAEETAYGYNQRAVWYDGQKGIAVPETDTFIGFDLDDYLEDEPLAHPPESLIEFLSSFDSQMKGAVSMDIDNGIRNRLQELGYLE